MKLKSALFTFLFLIFGISNLCAQTAASSPAESHYSLSETEFKSSLQEIETLRDKGDLLEAKKRYETLTQYEISKTNQDLIKKGLEDLNIRILFSQVITPDSIRYTVAKGDSLFLIAKKFNTTIDLIRRSNSIKKDAIHPGMKLKIAKAVFSIQVDISEHQLILLADGKPFKTYSIATGRKDHETPTGTFKIINKLENPTWYHDGVAVKPGNPENILGTRWMGISLESYGIHGTTLPETVGTSASEGCIRMLNNEVEELYSIVPLGTQVTLSE